MNLPNEPTAKEQRLLRNARREALLVMALWLACLIWSTVVALLFGYDRPADQVNLILGMPDWVFWAVALPWALCVVFSVWFCFVYMADDDLGQDPVEERHK